MVSKIFIYEKSKKNINKFKKLKLPGTLIKRPEDFVSQSKLIIICTPMSEYKNYFKDEQKISIKKYYNRRWFFKD